MATPVAIPQQDSIYDWLRLALNYRQYDQAIMFYNMMTPSQRYTAYIRYPYLIQQLNEIYVSQEMATAARTAYT